MIIIYLSLIFEIVTRTIRYFRNYLGFVCEKYRGGGISGEVLLAGNGWYITSCGNHDPSGRVRNLLGSLLLLAAFSCHASTDGENDFNLTQVAPGVYVHHGRMVSVEEPGRDDVANIGFIIGRNCVAVIDTGGSVRVGELLRQAIHRTTDVPICYVINTHIHYDHVLGNAAFAGHGVEFIGHEKLAPAIEGNREFFLKNFRQELGKNASAASIIGPDRLVHDTLELNLGNRKLLLTAYPPAHTNNDLTVYDETTRTLWLSDLLFMQRIPALDGSLLGWLAVLKKLTAIPADRAIPGHGPVSAPWPQAAGDEVRYLKTLRNQIRAKLKQGLFMEEIIDEVGSKEKTRWLLYKYQHKRNVSRAFTELEWE
jgi:quinoprotein relay system zinc metallohydrolase 2